MVGHVSLYQLLANACIAACRVASYPYVGVWQRSHLTGSAVT
jgi:hypothetical protein